MNNAFFGGHVVTVHTNSTAAILFTINSVNFFCLSKKNYKYVRVHDKQHDLNTLSLPPSIFIMVRNKVLKPGRPCLPMLAANYFELCPRDDRLCYWTC